jgi:pectinesterase
VVSATGGAVSATGGVATGGVVSTTGGSAGSSSGGSAGVGTSGAAGAGGVSSGGSAGAATGGVAGGAGSSTGGTAGAGAAATGGAGGNAGMSGGGAAGNAGTSAGGKGNPPGCDVTWGGAAARPQLSDASAACFTIAKYFEKAGTLGALTADNWDPTAGLAAASTFTATFTVASDGSGTHTTVQAAIDAANAAGGTTRAYILVKPGMYRELVCVKGTVPITLYGADADASKVTIAFDNYNGKAVDTSKTNACAAPSATATSYGTSGSTTFFASSNGFQAMNLTFANDFAEGTITSNIQAVALTAQGDQQVFQNVRVLGNQDTLQVKTPDGTKVSRIYFKNSSIEGDTDFIFGRATAVFDGCTITYVSGRKTNSTHISPSTENANPYGFLIINSKILGDANMPKGTASLGRAWDDSSATAPNGQALIRNSEIADHIVIAGPWAPAATSSRAFSADTNRLYEYKNTGAGAAP